MIESVRTGKNVKIRRAIIDKSVTISDGMNVGYDPKSDSKNFTITENGMAVVRKETYLNRITKDRSTY